MVALIHDPNVTFLLFVVAMIGIYVEISHPGVIFPGVTGSIALLLFFCLYVQPIVEIFPNSSPTYVPGV